MVRRLAIAICASLALIGAAQAADTFRDLQSYGDCLVEHGVKIARKLRVPADRASDLAQKDCKFVGDWSADEGGFSDGVIYTIERRLAQGNSQDDLVARLEGTWARDRKTCSLYLSGELERRGYDTATLSRFNVAMMRDGNFEMLAIPVRCKFSNIWNATGDSFSIPAMCQVKDYPQHPALATVALKSSSAISIKLQGDNFGPINIIKCD